MDKTGPDIFQYADYRQYLKDWWAWRKRVSRIASFRAFAEMAKVRRKLFLKFLPPDQYALWTGWHHAAIRELVTLEGFQEDPDWISQQLAPPVTPRQAKDALATLQRNGLLQRDDRGKLRPSEPAVSSEYEVPNQVVRHFNQEMISLALTAPDRFAPVDREVGGLTLGLSRECYDRVKERVRIFKEEILAMVVEDPRGSELVAQLNIQLFPLVKSESES